MKGTFIRLDGNLVWKSFKVFEKENYCVVLLNLKNEKKISHNFLIRLQSTLNLIKNIFACWTFNPKDFLFFTLISLIRTCPEQSQRKKEKNSAHAQGCYFDDNKKHFFFFSEKIFFFILSLRL